MTTMSGRGSPEAMRGPVDVQRRTRLADDVFKLDAVEYRVPGSDGRPGVTTRRLVLERGDSVAALLVQGERIWLVEQFRIATEHNGGGWLLELAAGILTAGESPEACIMREVHEETGFDVERLRPLGSCYLSPGGASERVHLFIADVGRRSGPGGGLVEDGEDIALVEFDRASLRAAWRMGRLQDAKTLIAVMAYFGARP